MTTRRLNPIGKYSFVVRTQIQDRLAYPLDLLGQALTIVLFLWIFTNLWRITYSSSGQSSIAGLSLNDTLWYLMMAEAVMLSKSDLSQRISDAVKDGSIAYALNKPYNFIVYQFAAGLGESLPNYLMNLVFGSLFIWWMTGPIPAPLGLLIVLPAVLLAYLIDFSISALIGLTAFVAEEVSAFRWIYQKFLLILGGILIPIDFFPDWLQALSLRLPFAWTIYGPARLFVDPQMDRFVQVMGNQILWLGLMIGLLAIAYRASIGRLTINGG